MWFVKSKRAQTSDDDETWIAGGVVPTLNAFDCGDTRATVLIFEATRVEDVRIYEDYCPTVARYWGTGGARVPYVYAIQGTVIGRSDNAGPQGKGFADDEEPMFTLDRVSGHGVAMAFDSYNQSVSETSQTIRKGQAGNDHVGMVMEKSVVRRLTPTECERLQGFPDGWTEGQADSHRYKQMGNAVAVPVVQWIIDRLVK
jgi:DNA (cytosine-5)-methyltransferase 1